MRSDYRKRLNVLLLGHYQAIIELTRRPFTRPVGRQISSRNRTGLENPYVRERRVHFDAVA